MRENHYLNAEMHIYVSSFLPNACKPLCNTEWHNDYITVSYSPRFTEHNTAVKKFKVSGINGMLERIQRTTVKPLV